MTRNADLSVDEDDAQDLLAAVELELHRRRFGQAVRLEVSAGISTDLLDMLVAEVDVPEDNVFLFDVPIDLGGLQDSPTGTASTCSPDPGRRWPRPGWPVGRHVRRPRRARRAGPSPLRVVRRLGRGLRDAGRGRSRRAGHQADPVPDRRRQPDRGRTDPASPGRQAGDRGGRAAGALRRAGQHRLGPDARGGRRAGRLRTGRPQDPLEDLAGGAARGRPDPPLLPRRGAATTTR